MSWSNLTTATFIPNFGQSGIIKDPADEQELEELRERVLELEDIVAGKEDIARIKAYMEKHNLTLEELMNVLQLRDAMRTHQ